MIRLLHRRPWWNGHTPLFSIRIDGESAHPCREIEDAADEVCAAAIMRGPVAVKLRGRVVYCYLASDETFERIVSETDGDCVGCYERGITTRHIVDDIKATLQARIDRRAAA